MKLVYKLKAENGENLLILDDLNNNFDRSTQNLFKDISYKFNTQKEFIKFKAKLAHKTNFKLDIGLVDCTEDGNKIEQLLFSDIPTELILIITTEVIEFRSKKLIIANSNSNTADTLKFYCKLITDKEAI